MVPNAEGDNFQNDTEQVLFSPEQLALCQKLPKIELHAHLNGSIRDSTIKELVATKGLDPSLTKLVSKGSRTLSECFDLFSVIHKLTTDHETITRITKEVVADFIADNVVYLELRTTPKARAEFGITKRSYAEVVLAGIKQALSDGTDSGAPGIVVHLLLSIDRRESLTEALETVNLAAALRAEGHPVVGIDLSGNPSIGEWATWEPALAHARDLGLHLTLHAAEVYNPQETGAMLRMQPGRVGHMCCLDAQLDKQLFDSFIPVELCLSSNVITESVPSYRDHHFLQLHSAGHPVVLCTDDSGVFSTSLSREYALAAHAFGLGPEQLFELAERAIEYTFQDEPGRQHLRDIFRTAKEQLLPGNG